MVIKFRDANRYEEKTHPERRKRGSGTIGRRKMLRAGARLIPDWSWICNFSRFHGMFPPASAPAGIIDGCQKI